MQWVLEGGHGPSAPDELFLHVTGDGSVTGVLYLGTQLVLATDDDAALEAFAAQTRRHPALRSFAGPKASIERFWDRVRSWHRPPVIARTTQPLYVLRPATLAPTPPLAVRPATLADAESVIENSAEMTLGELGYDPRLQRTSFAAGVRRAIARGQWWVYIDAGTLKFQLNVGAFTNATAQLQGVWTPPAQRKRGYAFGALGQIALRLLEKHPTLSLYVNNFNVDAIALYERVGFVGAGAMSTLLFV